MFRNRQKKVSFRRWVSRSVIAVGLTAAAVSAWGETITVGVTGGPHAAILEQVSKLASREDLQIKVVEFSDYQIPNAALSQGELDANSFQHQPFLDDQVKARGYRIVSVAKTVVFPIGLYSRKLKSLNDLKEGDTVAIPNDPTNGGRVLLLLQDAGLIKIRPDAGIKASALDVVHNPRRLKIVELPAAQLPRSLDDVTVAAVNSNYALDLGLVPHRDALLLERADSPYANVIAVRVEDKDKPAVLKLVRLYQSPAIRAFIQEKYGASVVPAF